MTKLKNGYIAAMITPTNMRHKLEGRKSIERSEARRKTNLWFKSGDKAMVHVYRSNRGGKARSSDSHCI